MKRGLIEPALIFVGTLGVLQIPVTPTLTPGWSLLVPPMTVHAQGVQIPCRDPKGCPDLIVTDKLKQWIVDSIDFSSGDCAVVEGCVDAVGPRLLMRFTANTPNIGKGDLIIGDPNAPENAGFFRLAECHRHLHMEEYADYRLWTVTGYKAWQELKAGNPGVVSSVLFASRPDIAKQMMASRKQGFCVIDLLPYNTPGAGELRPGQPKYLSCRRNQGISSGYADEYIFLLDCQWVDITHVPAGKYILEGEVNAERMFAESDYANNSQAVEVSVPNHNGRGGSASLITKPFKPYGCASCGDDVATAKE